MKRGGKIGEESKFTGAPYVRYRRYSFLLTKKRVCEKIKNTVEKVVCSWKPNACGFRPLGEPRLFANGVREWSRPIEQLFLELEWSRLRCVASKLEYESCKNRNVATMLRGERLVFRRVISRAIFRRTMHPSRQLRLNLESPLMDYVGSATVSN